MSISIDLAFTEALNYSHSNDETLSQFYARISEFSVLRAAKQHRSAAQLRCTAQYYAALRSATQYGAEKLS